MAREYNHPSSQTTFYNNDNYLGHHAYHQRGPYHQGIQTHQHYQPSEYYAPAAASYMTPANHAHHTNYTHPKPQISRGATRRPQQSSPIQTQNQTQNQTKNQTVHNSNNQIIYAQDMQPYTYSMTPKTSKPEIKHNIHNDTFYAQDIVQSPYSNPYSLSTSTTTTPQNEMSPVIDTTMYAQDTVQYPQTRINVNINHANHAHHEKNHGINASHTHHQHVHTQSHIHHTQPHVHTQPAPVLYTPQPQTHSHSHTHTHTNPYDSNTYHHATIHNRSHPNNRDTYKYVPKHEEYKYEEPRIPVPPKREYDIYNYKPLAAVNKDKQTLTKKDHHIFCGIQQADLYQTLWEHYHKNIELLLKVQSFVEEGGYYAANMKELRETMIIEQMMNKEQFQDFIENDYSNFINGQTVYINSIEIKTPKNCRVQALTKGIERIVNLKSMTMRVINDIDKMLTRLDDVMTDHANENDKITNYALQFTTKI